MSHPTEGEPLLEMSEPGHVLGVAASELQKRADSFANHLIERLERLNSEYSTNMDPIILRGAQGRIKDLNAKGYVFPKPSSSKLAFASLFCTYMVSRYVILPK
jgi:hypothetical protein